MPAMPSHSRWTILPRPRACPVPTSAASFRARPTANLRYAYLLTRRLERAASMLRLTDRSVTEICFAVGLTSLGSFTTTFTRTYGQSPTAYRAAHPPASSRAVIPMCVTRVYGRPSQQPNSVASKKAAQTARVKKPDSDATA